MTMTPMKLLRSKWWPRFWLAIGLAFCAYGAWTWPKPLAFVMGFVYGALIATVIWQARDRKMRDEVARQVAEDAIEHLKAKAEQAHLN